MPYTGERNLQKFRSRNSKRVRALPALVALALALAPAGAGAGRHSRTPGTGLRSISFAKPAPDFEFDAGAGATHLAALAGKPVVLNFWATWCEPCRAELPAIAQLRSAYGDSVTLLTVSDEAPGRARTFLADRHLDIPVIEDPQRKIFDLYSVTPIPVTLVLLADGTVSYVSIGETSYEELQSAVAGALISQGRSAAQAR